MEIIANTKDGCLIQATAKEVKEILNAVTGAVPETLKIGQKIPAIDYASTIKKIKSLKEDHDYKYLLSKAESFINEIEKLKSAVDDAGKIEL